MKTITKVLLPYTVISILCGSFAWGDHVDDNQPSPASFECHWTDSPPVIDGRADEPAWGHAQPIDHFYLPWLGSQAKPPRTATRARLLWDRKHLYFFADLEDKDLFADIDQRDGKTWHNDVLELFFKPGDSKPGWKVLKVLADLLELPGFDYTDSPQVADDALSLSPNVATSEVDIIAMEVPNVATVWQYTPYASDVLTRHAQSLQQTQIGQVSEATVSEATAKILELSQGDLYKGVPVNINETVAEGCVFVHTNQARQR